MSAKRLIVEMPDELHHKLKLKALKERTTIKELVNSILTKSLQ
jgi:predicted HicB family RNase H-like nuclease